ncbi:MAG: TonB-linked SusC/RagA family outer membrane protein [Saprospiraceae bacterium]|jgi:TonB-linked SusC/RagA family outer membrane protein
MKRILLFLFLSIFSMSFMLGQRDIAGTVVDQDGLGLLGANVLVKSTSEGTITDLDGSFSLSVPDNATTLLISFTGYETQEISIVGISNIDVTLAEGQLLDEIVVVGYGTTKKSDVVAAISNVSGDAVASLNIASIDNLLQGKSTGVEVTAVNGKPGANAYIRVRGLTSINGNNNPLFIVDGVPVPQTVFSAINASDIAEFSILKDAAATAIYGARASAGVVLVTTKRGSADNSYIEYSGQIGTMEAVDDGFTLMNASQKLNYELALGVRNPLTTEGRADLLRYGTDWENTLLRKAGLQSHNLAFSGGSDRGGYYLSMSRMDNQGLSTGSDFDRTTAKFNGDYKVNDWFSVSNSINISRRNDNELRDRNNVQSPFVGMYSYNPYETIYNLDDNGEILFDEFGEPDYNFTHQGFNIVEATRNNPESNTWSDMYGNVALNFTPIKGLRISSTGAYSYNTFQREAFIKPNSILDFYVGDTDAPGIKTDGGSSRDRYVFTNVAQYDYQISDRHQISALGGMEYVKNVFESYSISGKGFPVGLSVQEVAAEITDGFTRKNEFALFSLFGQLSYSLDNNFHIQGTVRRDGSSRFGADNRYGTFYSVGVGYNLANTVLKASWLDQLKVRASYGTTGNEPNEQYGAIGVLGFSSYADQTASFQANVSNPNLKWETQEAYSFGVDFGILNNAITGSLEYYNKKSTDLLFPNQLSRTTGFGQRLDNIGDLSNRGIEAEVNYSPFRGKDFFLDFGIRYSHNKTRMDRLVGSEEIQASNSFSAVLKEGEVAYVWELVEFSRVDPSNGDLLYFNESGEEVTDPTESDAVILSGKSAIPTFSGGFDVNMGYKGISLQTAFSFKGGNYIYNQRKFNLLSGADGARSQQDVEALDYWKNPGDVTEIPRPDAQAEVSTSTRFLEKGDYIRLRNVKLSYALPTSILEKIHVKGLTFFVAGQNLATFSNFQGDPEVGVFIEESVGTGNTVQGNLPGEYAGFSYPNTRTLTGGLTLRF